MSTSIPGNPHVESERDRNTHTNEGVIESNLAIAFELRTANLIALYASQPQTFPAGHPILTMLTKRLGL